MELEDVAISSSSLNDSKNLKLVVVLTGFSQLGNGNLDDLEKVISAFESDYADGAFDGKDVHGNPIFISLGNGNYQTALTGDPLNNVFLSSIVQFFQSGGSINIGLGNTNISLNPSELQSAITFSSGGSQPTVQFVSSSSSGSESVNIVSISVVLSAASSDTVTVNYTVSGTVTGGGVDHNLSNGAVTFNPGETTKNITFTVTDDTSAETSETIIITLGSPTNATLGANTTHTYTILDNDPPTIDYLAKKIFLVKNQPYQQSLSTIDGNLTNCTISPSLPSGLTFNSSNCQISGTPSATSSTTSYTVTAFNGANSSTVTFIITVVNDSSYTHSSREYFLATQGQNCDDRCTNAGKTTASDDANTATNSANCNTVLTNLGVSVSEIGSSYSWSGSYPCMYDRIWSGYRYITSTGGFNSTYGYLNCNPVCPCN